MRRWLIVICITLVSIAGAIVFTLLILKDDKNEFNNEALKSTMTLASADFYSPVPTMSSESEPSTVPVTNKVLERWPVPTFSPIFKSSGSVSDSNTTEVKPAKRYLIENPIKIIEEKKVYQYNKEIVMQLSYPEIQGLVDLSVQNKINNELKGVADELIKNTERYSKDLYEVRLSYNVSANYNNIICIKLFKYIRLQDNDSISIKETLLYELVNGKRLELKDVFKENTGYPDLLNKAIEEYIIKKNLEERILKAPFKGVRVDQNYSLSDSRLIIEFDKNDEISSNMMINEPNNISFRLTQFSPYVDIYDKYANPGKKIYQSDEIKKKMLPNDFEEKFMSVHNKVDNFRTTVNGRMFSGMKNKEFEEKLNRICSYAGENEFRKILSEAPQKTYSENNMPAIMREYYLIGNYCDVISIAFGQRHYIPEFKDETTNWHKVYNIVTGQELSLQDIFKNNFDWRKAILSFVKERETEAKLEMDASELSILLENTDFWFDEDKLHINLKPEESLRSEKLNPNLISIPMEYFGDENLTIRE